MDRSVAMQTVGQQRAAQSGFKIKSTIGDVHRLPFPDKHFDVVTLQFASRHLRVREVFSEIHRVLKPGGHFHHSDMLRPRNPVVKGLYYAYLKACLNFTSLIVGSSPMATKFKQYRRWTCSTPPRNCRSCCANWLRRGQRGYGVLRHDRFHQR